MKKRILAYVLALIMAMPILPTMGNVYAVDSKDESAPLETQEKLVDEDSQEETKGSQEDEGSPKEPSQEVLPTPSVSYETHVQNIGWMDAVSDGQMGGTQGKALRMECIRIKVNNDPKLGIKYGVHVQNYGWMNKVEDGADAGTSGECKRLEAITIELTGEHKDLYDVYYCTHAQNIGWMGWAKNGEMSGTAGYAYRLEGIKIQIVPKGQAMPAFQGQSGRAFETRHMIATSCHVQNIGDMSNVENGAIAGTVGQAKRLEAVQISFTNKPAQGDILYKTHIQNDGWEKSLHHAGEVSGTKGQAKRLEAITIQLTGDLEKEYNIFYRTHVQNFGWMGWAKNGEVAGSEGFGYRMEAMQILMLPKRLSGPKGGGRAFAKHVPAPIPSYGSVGIGNYFGFTRQELIGHLNQYKNRYIGTPYIELPPLPGVNGHMQCDGFIHYVFRYIATRNRDNVPLSEVRPNYKTGGGFVNWGKRNSIKKYEFPSKKALLASGKCKKGDIILIFDGKGPRRLSNTHHFGFFWGDSPSEDKFWHSGPGARTTIYEGKPGHNRISQIEELTNDTTAVWLYKIEND